MQQDLLETAVDGHVLVFGQVLEQGRQPLLEPHRHGHAFDLERRSGIVDVVPEGEVIPVEILYSVIAQTILPVGGRYNHLDTVGLLKLEELIRVADHEIDRAAVRRGRSMHEKYLNRAEIDASDGDRFAPDEAGLETKFRRVKIHRGRYIKGA